MTNNLGLARSRFAVGNLRFSDEIRSFLNDEVRGLQIALKSATRLKLATFSDGDVAVDFTIDDDRFRRHITIERTVLADQDNGFGHDFT